MVRNEEKYQQAVQFRKRGFTYSEIAKIVDVVPSTVSAWLAKKPFSKKIAKENTLRANKENKKRLSLINKARTTERLKQYRAAEQSAETEYKHYKTNPLFVAGLMLYVGEGDNKDKRLIRIANSRTDVHKIFIRFLVEYLGVAKETIRFWVLLYPDLDQSACEKYWCKALKLPKEQLYKTQIIAGKSKKRTLQYGVGNTIIGNTVLKHKLNRWIELAAKDLSQ